MDKDKLLLIKLWERHLNNHPAGFFTPEQLIHVRRAFYTGLMGMMTSIKHISNLDITDEARHQMYDSMLNELQIFMDLVKEGKM